MDGSQEHIINFFALLTHILEKILKHSNLLSSYVLAILILEAIKASTMRSDGILVAMPHCVILSPTLLRLQENRGLSAGRVE